MKHKKILKIFSIIIGLVVLGVIVIALTTKPQPIEEYDIIGEQLKHERYFELKSHN